MNTPPIKHDTLAITRTYDAPPARVFAAWADPKARVQWSTPDGTALIFDEADFRPGGRDLARCGDIGDLRFAIESRYAAIATDQYIIIAETVSEAGRMLSASLITATFTALAPDRTQLALTVQIAALDAAMCEGNQQGWSAVLDKLTGWLARKPD